MPPIDLQSVSVDDLAVQRDRGVRPRLVLHPEPFAEPLPETVGEGTGLGAAILEELSEAVERRRVA